MFIKLFVGLSLVLAGALFAAYSFFEDRRRGQSSRNDRSKTVSETMSAWGDRLQEGLVTNVDIKGYVFSSLPSTAPFSEKEAAYFEYHCIYEEHDNLSFFEKQEGDVFLSDKADNPSSPKVYINMESLGGTLDLEKSFDGILSSVKPNRIGSNLKTQLEKNNYSPSKIRVVEKMWEDGSEINIIGQLYKKDGRLFIGCSGDKELLTATKRLSSKKQVTSYRRGVILGAVCSLLGIVYCLQSLFIK